MQLTPRFGDPPLLVISPALVPDVAAPTVRQHRRLADELGKLDAAGWAAPTRCEGWSVQDVVAHLVTTNQFWAYSITQGTAGEPSQLLVGFDPVASPAEMVAAVRSRSPEDTYERFRAGNDALCELLGSVDGPQWDLPAEAPPGHVAIRSVVLHAHWDSWIHERDILVPAGAPTDPEPDEVAAALVYAAALGPAFLASTGSTRPGTLEVVATDPDVRFVIEHGEMVRVHEGPAPAGTPVVEGDAVALLEGLSFRAPLATGLAGPDEWLLGALDQVFDTSR
jgi:uncharacterized protein (TIGR03083 family)